MEPVGKKLQQARLAKNITLEEASRATKIRPSRLAEIEDEDFSNFPSLAYGKGFLLIYGKFLDVDVTPYLEAFETSKRVTVDGYSYLQDNPAGARRPTTPRPQTRASLLPLFIGAAVLILGFFAMKLILDIQRIAPPHERSPRVVNNASPTPTAAATVSGVIAAPRALPVESTPAPVASARPSNTPAPVVLKKPTPSASEPEVRRAEPVHPEDLARSSSATAPTRAPVLSRVEIRPLKKTFVRVVVDNHGLKPAIDRWINPSDGPVMLRGQHFSIHVDRDAVEITKDGKPLSSNDPNVTIE
jgi:cytoskeletal protein RodZ